MTVKGLSLTADLHPAKLSKMYGDWTNVHTIEHYCELARVYGKMLTLRQQDVVRLFFFEDLSLSEIAEELEITRQGVHEHLYRACESLDRLEDTIQHVSGHKRLESDLDKILQIEDLSEMQVAIRTLARQIKEGE